MLAKISKNVSFYEILESQSQVALRSARAFHALAADFTGLDEKAEEIDRMEHEGDELARRLTTQLATTFITPLDKEDLRALSQALDDITDYIEAAAARAQLYKLKTVRPDLAPLVGLLVRTCEVTYEAVAELKNGFHKSPSLRHKLADIHALENESDRAFRQALADLFEDPSADALTVIKWKEVYDRIEKAVDSCEDVAKLMGDVLIKYA